MSDVVDQKLFTQDELVLLAMLSAWSRPGGFGTLYDDEAGMLVHMVRRLALRVTQLQKLVEANGS